MKIEIKSWYDGKILFEGEFGSLKLAVEAAVGQEIRLSGASLAGANLAGANLAEASLARANLDGASLAGANLAGANLAEASLARANLDGARLAGARLARANLDGASLDEKTILPTGETWKEYLTVVVPALLTAGGKSLQEIATPKTWDCHTWENCPMAEAFGGHSLQDVPILLRPRAEQFIKFFDAKLIPLETINPGGKP